MHGKLKLQTTTLPKQSGTRMITVVLLVTTLTRERETPPRSRPIHFACQRHRRQLMCYWERPVFLLFCRLFFSPALLIPETQTSEVPTERKVERVALPKLLPGQTNVLSFFVKQQDGCFRLQRQLLTAGITWPEIRKGPSGFLAFPTSKYQCFPLPAIITYNHPPQNVHK